MHHCQTVASSSINVEVDGETWRELDGYDFRRGTRRGRGKQLKMTFRGLGSFFVSIFQPSSIVMSSVTIASLTIFTINSTSQSPPPKKQTNNIQTKHPLHETKKTNQKNKSKKQIPIKKTNPNPKNSFQSKKTNLKKYIPKHPKTSKSIQRSSKYACFFF